MLAFAFLLLMGSHGPAPTSLRIYVNPSESRDTFHIAYPRAWNLERHEGSIMVAPPNGEMGLTISLHPGKGDTTDTCAAANLQVLGGAFTSTPIRQSLITMNWRAVWL